MCVKVSTCFICSTLNVLGIKDVLYSVVVALIVGFMVHKVEMVTNVS